MAKTVVVKTANDLMKELSGGKLYGYTPAQKVDATKFVYPVTFTLDDETKTYTVQETEVKADTVVTISAQSGSNKKSKLIRNIVIGFVAVVVVAIVVYAVVA